MKPNPVHRLPAPLETAVQRLKLAAREAAERTIESLGLAALASTSAFQRDGLLGAQFELNRKSAVFVLSFNDAFDERMLRELGPRLPATPNPRAGHTGTTLSGPTSHGAEVSNWDALSLVEDKEVEAQILADRFGLEIAHACEWELRELEGYVATLLGEAGGERDRNPLRPDLVGFAMIRGIAAVSDREETRKILSSELSRSLGGLLRSTYADIVAELRHAGVQPMGLSVRQRGVRSAAPDSGADEDSLRALSAFDRLGRATAASAYGASGYAEDSRYHSRRDDGGFSNSRMAGGVGRPGGRRMAPIDPALMAIIRRLVFSEAGGQAAGYGGEAGDLSAGPGETGSGLPANLIRSHREELRQATQGALDHMVIDLIGFLFDQILADPKVPPQMARQIARLQLPVLRAALGDPSFFSSRRHPVRRFINRIASLGSAFEDYGDEAARGFLAKVKSLVHEVVEGDFDHIEIYEQQLAALEAFSASLAANAAQPEGQAASLLDQKEDQHRLQQLYAERLAGELKDVSAPAFLRDFISGVWSQVLMNAAEQGGAEGALAQRLRAAGRELYLSVQPKPTPALRKAFLGQLPKLMQELTEGLNLIRWPEVQRRAFFGQLMPAHAEALKTPGGSVLDINLMARKVDGALRRPPPSTAELRSSTPMPVLTEELAPTAFSLEEAAQVGLISEASVDWQAPVTAEAEPAAPAAAAVAVAVAGSASAGSGVDLELDVPASPSLAALVASEDALEPPDPTEGSALVDHVQVGFAYQMNLEGEWRRVRLAHVSAGRSFFLFTHGGRHQKSVSLTYRMLSRLCACGRLKAYESASLFDRASARARRQLASLGAGG